MKVPKFQNLSEKDGKVCIKDTMVWVSWAWRTVSACTGSATVVLWVSFLLSKPSTTRPLTHTLLPQEHSLSSTRAILGSGYTSSHPLLAKMSCPADPVWDPHGLHQDLSLWSRHTDTRTGNPTPLPHLLLAFSSISVMRTNAAKDFPSNPCLKITLGCGRKASRLTLPHAALFWAGKPWRLVGFWFFLPHVATLGTSIRLCLLLQL